MQNEKYLELDALAAPNGYVAPPMKEDLAYVVHFRMKTPLQSEPAWVGHSGVFLIFLEFSTLSRIAYLKMIRSEILTTSGHVSNQQALQKAYAEYDTCIM